MKFPRCRDKTEFDAWINEIWSSPHFQLTLEIKNDTLCKHRKTNEIFFVISFRTTAMSDDEEAGKIFYQSATEHYNYKKKQQLWARLKEKEPTHTTI